MAYSHSFEAKKPNLPAIAAVGALHVAIAAGLIVGLGVTFIPKKDDPPLPTIKFPTAPPKKSDGVKVKEMDSIPIFTPKTGVDIPQPNDVHVDVFEGPKIDGIIENFGHGTGDTGVDLGKILESDKKPYFAPKIAKPKNDPHAWVTTDDYPSHAIRAEEEGVVGVMLDVGADGRVTNCAVTSSSGFADLDRVTCDKISARARFEAAKDSTGASITGNYSKSVRWELPKE